MGAGDKDPAYIMAQNTCLKFIVLTLLFIGFVIVVLGTTIYKVDLRSKAAQQETENEKVVSRLEERNTHHRLIETHINLKTALKGQVTDLQEVGSFYHLVQNELSKLKKSLPPNLHFRRKIDIFAKRVDVTLKTILERMSSRGRRAQDLMAEMERATRTEVARDKLEENRYHDFFLKQKGRSHDEIAKLEEEADQNPIKGFNTETKAKDVKVKAKREKHRVKMVVESFFKWFHEELEEKGTKGLKSSSEDDVSRWKKFRSNVEAALVEAAMGSPGKRDLSALELQLRDDMDLAGWDYPSSADLRTLVEKYGEMIQRASMLLHMDQIRKVRERYLSNFDTYEAMDKIEELMVYGIVPAEILDGIYAQVRASETDCSFLGPHPHTSLEGVIETFGTLEAAKSRCSLLDECGGITELQQGSLEEKEEKSSSPAFTIRRGSKLHNSKYSRSWVKDCRGKETELEDAVIQAQAEAIAGF
eukprot:CAMPEP_0184479952 /NCGR_PEP_ID=MMETSP0113_2-20130426/1468_1 /TAXON_ID=91329 /ORGANISM="Norrisiella sphaerica, Strain BC52" /LENGTH=473 /DNA_ID=CAMNT_0026858129 /DNA_START=213 /DNA_END=1634 /DNA_ORIENTATION=-